MTDTENEHALFELVRKAGFEGPPWTLLAERLVRHGLAVVGPWIRSGRIFSVAAQKGWPLQPTMQERRTVAGRLHEDFLQETVTLALEKFRRKAIEGEGWRSDGGTSLATYFINACVQAFVDYFRRSRRSGELYDVHIDYALPGLVEDGPAAVELVPCRTDVAALVVNRMAWHSRLARLGDRDRGLVWGKTVGLRGAEIAELFGWPSTKAVEQRWSRLKRDTEWIRGLTGTEE
ncbi:hypothetical protein ACWIGI_21960 [Nocardia sp. NPDC055321]